MKPPSLLRKLLWMAALGTVVLVMVVVLLVVLGSEIREQQLHASLRQADRVIFRTGGMCHRDLAREEIILDTTDPSTISGMVSNIQIAHSPGNFFNLRCMCCGEHTFEFHAGGKLIRGLTVHHEIKLRPDTDELEYVLTRDTREYITQLAAQQKPGPGN